MLNFSEISQDILIARGQYSTVRAAHEDSKKGLSVLCGRLASVATQILRGMQPDNDGIPLDVKELLSSGREYLREIEVMTAEIEELAKQRAELKKLAWGK